MATFNAPPMDRKKWAELVDFDRKVRAETGASFLDHSTLKYIHEYSRRSREPVQKTIPGVIVGAEDDPLLLKAKEDSDEKDE